MDYEEYSHWTAKKITLLTAEMATSDQNSQQFKRLAKQKRSQEDRLLKRKNELDKALKLEIMDAAMTMIIKEARKVVPADRMGVFYKQLILEIRSFK